MCDKCQNPNMLGQAERGSVGLGQIREGFPEEEAFGLMGEWREAVQAERKNLRERTREDLPGSPLKLGAEKTKGDSRGGKGLYCAGGL